MIKKLLLTGLGLSLALGLTHCSESKSISSTTNTENVVYLSISDSIDLVESRFRMVNSKYNTLVSEDGEKHAPINIYPTSREVELPLLEDSLVLLEVVDTIALVEYKSWVYLNELTDSVEIGIEPSIGIKGMVEIPRINGFVKVYLQLVGTDRLEDVSLYKESFSEVPIAKDTAYFDFPSGIGVLPKNQSYMFRVFWIDKLGTITKSTIFPGVLD